MEYTKFVTGDVIVVAETDFKRFWPALHHNLIICHFILMPKYRIDSHSNTEISMTLHFNFFAVMFSSLRINEKLAKALEEKALLSGEVSSLKTQFEAELQEKVGSIVD